ncbi:MAG: hypothetical protein V1660_00250 [archaeon]
MRFVDLCVGAAVLIMGFVPLAGSVAGISSITNLIGEPGKTTYQAILIVIGLLTILYSFGPRMRYIRR